MASFSRTAVAHESSLAHGAEGRGFSNLYPGSCDQACSVCATTARGGWAGWRGSGGYKILWRGLERRPWITLPWRASHRVHLVHDGRLMPPAPSTHYLADLFSLYRPYLLILVGCGFFLYCKSSIRCSCIRR